jgi:hypothetical protein
MGTNSICIRKVTRKKYANVQIIFIFKVMHIKALQNGQVVGGPS